MFCHQIWFNLYNRRSIEELGDLEGMRVGRINVNNIGYANDTVLIAGGEEKLQELVTVWK